MGGFGLVAVEFAAIDYGVDHRGGHGAGADGVDPDAPGAVFEGGALGHADHAVLGGAVGGAAGVADEAGTVDDAAASLVTHVPRYCLQQRRNRAPAHRRRPPSSRPGLRRHRRRPGRRRRRPHRGDLRPAYGRQCAAVVQRSHASPSSSSSSSAPSGSRSEGDLAGEVVGGVHERGSLSGAGWSDGLAAVDDERGCRW